MQANFKFIPAFSVYKCNDETVLAAIASNPTKFRNSSLAIQLSYDWIRKNPHKLKSKSIFEYLNKTDGLTLPTEVTEALVKCYWPGRCQTICYKNMTLHIDGAHTIDSLHLCVDWFINMTKSRWKFFKYIHSIWSGLNFFWTFSNSPHKIFLLFNVTGDRNANDMLDLLNGKIQFEQALFTPNISTLCEQAKGKFVEFDFTWHDILLSLAFLIDNVYTFAQPNRSKQNAEYWSSLGSDKKSQSFPCITDAFKYLEQNYRDDQISILVTGSLHLVGEVLRSIKD